MQPYYITHHNVLLVLHATFLHQISQYVTSITWQPCYITYHNGILVLHGNLTTSHITMGY